MRQQNYKTAFKKNLESVWYVTANYNFSKRDKLNIINFIKQSEKCVVKYQVV